MVTMEPETCLETVVLTIVRNEMDVLPSWLAHVRSLIDHVYIVNHLSSDGSAEYLQQSAAVDENIRLFSFNERVYDRQKIIRTLRRRALAETDAEWFFIIDPDEYLPYGNRRDFHAPLRDEHGVVLYRWRNCHLTRPGPVGMQEEILQQVRRSSIGKVAIHRSVMADPKVHIPRGAHSVVEVGGGPLPSTEVGELLHVPFRSMRQAWEKILLGVINRLGVLQKTPKSKNNWHYEELLRLMLEDPAWETVMSLVYDYGEPDNHRRIRSALSADSLATEFQSATLKLLGEPLVSGGKTDEAADAPTVLPIADLMTEHRFRSLLEELMTLNRGQKIPLSDELTVIGNGDLVHPADFAGHKFEPLGEDAPEPITTERVAASLQAAYWDIDYVPGGSAWGTHIPFQFSIVSLLRPRRYVELGVQAGASFFAACQAVQRQGLETTCVAIDNWIGDPHAGETADGEFDRVRSRMAEQYGDFAGYIRADFDEAVSQFATGAIDLLHIDGFHTAAAVTHDFESWVDKMSDEGVIMFHDINEFKKDFGVWRFWRKIREQYPHIEFGHGHGLGVLVVGEKSPLAAPIEGSEFSLTSPVANELLQVIYGGVGQMSWVSSKRERMDRGVKQNLMEAESKLVVTERKLARKERQLEKKERQLEKKERQLEKLRKSRGGTPAKLRESERAREALRKRVRQLENSTSWRVTAPLRAFSRLLKGKA